MRNFIREWLGITGLEAIAEWHHTSIGRIEKKLGMAHIAKSPQRYDEIERARKLRRKDNGNKIHYHRSKV